MNECSFKDEFLNISADGFKRQYINVKTENEQNIQHTLTIYYDLDMEVPKLVLSYKKNKTNRTYKYDLGDKDTKKILLKKFKDGFVPFKLVLMADDSLIFENTDRKPIYVITKSKSAKVKEAG